jgi:DNA repair protein RecN (Recombination protein N)
LELDEVRLGVERYLDRLEIDPNRLITVEKRLGAVELLKKRFGGAIEEKILELKAQMATFAALDLKMASLAELEAKNLAKREAITVARKAAAPRLAQLVLEELRQLNMPHAQFEIAVGDVFGDVQFHFSANPGLAPLPFKECASSGEFARLILSIKTVLAEGNATLVFDEIDSNIGGQTAAVLGEKLKHLSLRRQIICVTHFVQVARCAIDHFLVAKVTSSSESTTFVTKLDAKERGIEYDRMLGNK